jgi:hypothetical protein
MVNNDIKNRLKEGKTGGGESRRKNSGPFWEKGGYL